MRTPLPTSVTATTRCGSNNSEDLRTPCLKRYQLCFFWRVWSTPPQSEAVAAQRRWCRFARRRGSSRLPPCLRGPSKVALERAATVAGFPSPRFYAHFGVSLGERGEKFTLEVFFYDRKRVNVQIRRWQHICWTGCDVMNMYVTWLLSLQRPHNAQQHDSERRWEIQNPSLSSIHQNISRALNLLSTRLYVAMVTACLVSTS